MRTGVGGCQATLSGTAWRNVCAVLFSYVNQQSLIMIFAYAVWSWMNMHLLLHQTVPLETRWHKLMIRLLLNGWWQENKCVMNWWKISLIRFTHSDTCNIFKKLFFRHNDDDDSSYTHTTHKVTRWATNILQSREHAHIHKKYTHRLTQIYTEIHAQTDTNKYTHKYTDAY